MKNNIGLTVGIIIGLVTFWTCLGHPLDHSKKLENLIQHRNADGIKSYAGYKLFMADVAFPQLPVVDSMDTLNGVDVWSWRHKGRSEEYEVDVLSPPDSVKQVQQVFSDYQLRYMEIIDDLQDAINKEQPDEINGLFNRPGHPMSWEKYHPVQDMHDYIMFLEKHFPHFVTAIDIGNSYENRSIILAKVSLPSEKKKPAIWIDGGMHAREWIAPATVMYILRQLVEFNWEHPQLIEEFDWYILPVANPDGYEYAHQHDRLWRKTRSINANNPYCVGVDANRNFGFRWNSGGSSDDPCSDVYAGTEAFSEPESRAVRDFLLEHKDQLKGYVTTHSYSQMWMMPWSSSLNTAANYKDLHEVGKLAVDAIRKFNGTKYSLGSVSELLYVASGSSGDYAYGEVGIPFTYFVELRDLGRYGFILPKEQIESTGMETFEGIKAMAEGISQRLHKY